MNAAGRTLLVGELREVLAGLADDVPVVVDQLGNVLGAELNAGELLVELAELPNLSPSCECCAW